jgi:hypothetical protein
MTTTKRMTTMTPTLGRQARDCVLTHIVVGRGQVLEQPAPVPEELQPDTGRADNTTQAACHH